MASQRPEADGQFEEALQTLQRLAGVAARAGSAPPGGAAPAALPPRSAELPSWSEQSFRELVEGLPDGVVVIDDAGAVVLVNRQAERMFGYAREELLGEAIEVLVPERLRGKHVALRDGFLAAPRRRPLGVGLELFGRRKDGSEFPVEISLSPLRGGPRLLVTAVVRDVTDRKRSEAKFRTLVENIPAVTFIAPLDDSTPELYVSPQIEQLLGFSQKEWLEDPVLWHRQLHPDDRDRWNRHFAPTCAEGDPFRASYRFLAKDGRVVWVHGSANMVRDERDRLLFLQGVAFDITPIKEAEHVREEQARLAVLRADVSAAITGTDDAAGMLARCVAALERDLDGASAAVWLLDEAGPKLAAGAPVGAAEVGLIAARRAPLVSADPPFAGYLLQIDDRLLGVLALATRAQLSPAARQTLELIAAQLALGLKRKQAEEDLRRANAELERRVRERTEELTRSLAESQEKTEELRKYSYHATHDIKEPLRTVLAQTQRVTRAFAGQLPGDAGERLAKVVTAVGRMEVLLERLKLYAQVSLDARLQDVDCGEAVRVALGGLEASVEESGAAVEVGELPTVVGMKEHLELLFQNLIGNAIKYRSPDRPPRVEVGASRHPDGWLFWVRDNGDGIEPRYWKKIFGIAERLDARKSGWGYGLAICEKTVARHGGRIWVSSEPGQGSTFYFTLPAKGD